MLESRNLSICCCCKKRSLIPQRFTPKSVYKIPQLEFGSCPHAKSLFRTPKQPTGCAPVQSVLRHFVVPFYSHFRKTLITGTQTCRTALIWSALESTDPGAFNGGPSVRIWPFESDLVTFEITRLPCNWVCNWQKCWQNTALFWKLKHLKCLNCQ